MKHENNQNTGVLVTGIIAGALSIIAFAPHAWAIYNSSKKKPKSRNLWTYVVYAVSLLLWGVYGCLHEDIPLIVTGFLQFAVVSFVFICVICARSGSQSTQQLQDPSQHGVQTRDEFEQDEFEVNDVALL